MTDPVARLLEQYTDGLEADPQPALNLNRLEQRVRGSLRERAVERRRSVTRLQTALALAAAFAVVSAAAAFSLGQRGADEKAAALVPAGDWVTAGAQRAEERKFGDGSSLRLERDSAARVQFVMATGGLVHLDRGSVRLKVHHRDGSTWRVAAGPYEVEAIGTEFVVEWAAAGRKPLRVSVSEGTVAVRGPAFKGTRFVSAHQSVEVNGDGVSGEEAAGSPAAPVEILAQETEATTTGSRAPGNARVPGSSDRTWRVLEADGKYADAVKAAERGGLSNLYQTGGSDDLLALARAARFASRTDIAREALMACRARFAGSQQAAMAAFLLGRAASGAQAAEWFSAYLKEQPNGALAREALGRLVEAYEAAGNHVSGRASAERYLKTYPGGPHAALARQALHR